VKALIYRPNSRWQIVSAFTIAAAVHLSAVAFASRHRDAPIIPSSGFTEVGIEPTIGEVPPQPPQEDLPAPEATHPSEFVETQMPVVHRIFKRPGPIPSSRPPNVGAIQAGNGKAPTLNAPRPAYPYEARSHQITGSGVAMLIVDPLTGCVLCATMSETTGSPVLDNSALSAFRRWRFKPGTPSPVRVPVTFTLTGAVF
jgi:periplasmic protein TonB